MKLAAKVSHFIIIFHHYYFWKKGGFWVSFLRNENVINVVCFRFYFILNVDVAKFPSLIVWKYGGEEKCTYSLIVASLREEIEFRQKICSSIITTQYSYVDVTTIPRRLGCPLFPLGLLENPDPQNHYHNHHRHVASHHFCCYYDWCCCCFPDFHLPVRQF